MYRTSSQSVYKKKSCRYNNLITHIFRRSISWLIIASFIIVLLYLVLCLSPQYRELMSLRKTSRKMVILKVDIRGSKCLQVSMCDDSPVPRPKHRLCVCEWGRQAFAMHWREMPSSTFQNRKQQGKVEISTFASASFDIVNNISMSDFPINSLWTWMISCLLPLQVVCEVFLVTELWETVQPSDLFSRCVLLFSQRRKV